eukprot:TRINITY_DN12827_c0_g1_i1.p1 TRINITY_DN12827_c0_g1~~TRINITY_DN12827_c0_g1_i1.p1  ORF type:complete len:241 (-),score=51.90 TRINITY_DN12827_c0_g1_i1:64-717(-)
MSEDNVTPKKVHVCVFCGANSGNNPAYATAAEELGAEIGRRQLRLVYGGGVIGLMGIVARSTLAHSPESSNSDSPVLGFIPHEIARIEMKDMPAIGELVVVPDMATRKNKFAEHADFFIALPGGLGTLEEVSEVLNHVHLGVGSLARPRALGLLNVNGFWDHYLSFIDHAIQEGFVRAKSRDILVVESDVGRLLDRLLEKQELPSGIMTSLDEHKQC